MKVKITKIFRGVQKTKNGDVPKTAIKVEDPKYQDKWISALGSSVELAAKSWQEGSEIEVDIKPSASNANFFNFDLPGKEKISDIVDMLRKEVEDLKNRIELLEANQS